MNFINYISTIIIPFVIVFAIGYGIAEKKNVYDIFIVGAKKGVKIVIELFPTLLAIFLAINDRVNFTIAKIIKYSCRNNAISYFKTNFWKCINGNCDKYYARKRG